MNRRPRPIHHRASSIVPVLILLVATSGPARATLPCEFQETSTFRSDGGWILAVPDGSGSTLAQAGATVEVQLVECETLNPIVGYPPQDVYLGDADAGTLSICPGGTIADGATDAEGRTTISGSLAAGGQANGVLVDVGVFATHVGSSCP